jgi:glycosyltransferase involved in cell wall biosynthesis
VKVLHLGKLCPPKEGGIELFTYDLLEYLNSKGIKADLLCFGNKTFKDSYKGFDFYSCKMNINLNSAPLSWDFIKTFRKIEKNYDLIHIHSPNPLAEILSLFSKKPVIVHWHSDIVKQKVSYIFYKPFQQKVLKKANKIICTSPQYLESSEQLKNVKNKAVIIPSGLNPERLNSDKEDEKMKMVFNKLKGKKIVFALGRLVEYKGFKYLVEAGQYIGDDIVIIIGGYGPLYKDLNKRIYELKLQNKVFLIGRINIISSYIKNCDIFCLPSITRNEAFGLVLVEALYFGKPLITTDVKGSGMNYVNKHNITGLIVPPKDPKALAEAINKVLTDKNLYKKFSYNAKKRFKEFEISNIGNQILKLYEEVLK